MFKQRIGNTSPIHLDLHSFVCPYRPFRYLDEWPYVGLNMSRSLGDSKLHAVGVSDVPDVTSIFLEDGPSPQPLGVEVYKLIWMMILVGMSFFVFKFCGLLKRAFFLLDVD